MILPIPRRPRGGCIEWHRWFAWYPVRVTADYVVWLAFVERSRLRWSHEWIYRFTEAQLDKIRAPF